MSAWSDKPPTYKEWRDAKNHGCWWVKFILSRRYTEIIDGESITWPEAWYTEVVTIAAGYEGGKLLDPDAATLHARGSILKSIDLSDSAQTKDMYWQPVVAPVDDIKDERPKV